MYTRLTMTLFLAAALLTGACGPMPEPEPEPDMAPHGVVGSPKPQETLCYDTENNPCPTADGGVSAN